jgi:hypothetical protein
MGEKPTQMKDFMARRAEDLHSKKVAGTESFLRSLQHSSSNDSLNWALLRGMAGAGMGHLGGGPMGAMIGGATAAAAPHLPAIGARYWNNRAMNPINEAILKSLVTTGGVQATQ